MNRNKKCKVSIIMPSLNVADYIDECIQSALDQTLEDIEIICIDAGSTDGTWEKFFTVKPEILTREEKRAWLDQMTDVCLGSDAFFPFGDNIERANKSGVKYIAQPGGSVRDDNVIETSDKYDMVMCFTGIRLFHH